MMWDSLMQFLETVKMTGNSVNFTWDVPPSEKNNILYDKHESIIPEGADIIEAEFIDL